MADVPISGLPAASSVAGPDLVPVVQGGTTKQATATLLLNALSGASSATLAALTDALTIIQSSTAKQITVQKVLDAGSGAASINAGLTDTVAAFRSSAAKTTTVNSIWDSGFGLSSASTPLATSDKLVAFQGGAAKTVISSGLSVASSSFNGLMTSVDKTLFDTHTSDGTGNSLVQYSSTGGLRIPRLLLNGGSGSGLVIESMWFDPASKTFSGGANTENFNITVPSGVFTSVPTWGMIWPEDPHYNATWLNTDPGNTTTNLVCQLHKIDGTNITSGTKVLFGLWVYLTNTPI